MNDDGADTLSAAAPPLFLDPPLIYMSASTNALTNSDQHKTWKLAVATPPSVAVADPEIFWKKARSGWQRVSPVVIYLKCTQRTICLLHGKRRLIWNFLRPIGATPRESATDHRWYRRPRTGAGRRAVLERVPATWRFSAGSRQHRNCQNNFDIIRQQLVAACSSIWPRRHAPFARLPLGGAASFAVDVDTPPIIKHSTRQPSTYRQCDNYNRSRYRRCNNIVSYEFIWIRRTCDWMLTTACCLGLGLGLGIDLVSGW